MLQNVKHLIFGPEISIVHQFHKPPYGGGNQFLLALKNSILGLGYDIGAMRIGPHTRYVLFNSFNFNMDELRRKLHNRERRGIRTLHRVDGPISAYRGRNIEIDQSIHKINQDLADVTVFQSNFSLQKHKEIGLQFDNSHVIMNAVNPAIFHPCGRNTFPHKGERKIRIVATSWSPNRRKGADVYEWLDQNLDFNHYEMTFAGNTEARFKNIRCIPPLPSAELSDLLRQQDIYITASQHDPCSNALIEALSCGLPALYRKSGGHPEIVGSAGYGFDNAEEIPELLDTLVNNYEECRTNISVPHIDSVAQQYLSILLAQE